MKYCTNCGNELPGDASFCSNCGMKFDGEATQARLKEINTEAVKETLNKTFSQTKETIQNSGYFNYLMKTAKQPTAIFNEEQSNNGLIHFGVLSVVTALAIYFLIAGTISVAMNQSGLGFIFGSSTGYLSEVRQLIPNLVLMSVTAYAVFILSAFIIMKFSADRNIKLGYLLNEFGGLLTPNLILLSFAAVTSLLIKSELIMTISLTIISFTLLLSFLAFNYYIYVKTYNDKSKTFYMLLVSNILVFLLFSIIIYVQVEPLITAFDRLGSLGW